MAKCEIDLNKTYTFPKEIKAISYNDKILVVAPEYANWIVLESKTQLSVLDFFRKNLSSRLCQN